MTNLQGNAIYCVEHKLNKGQLWIPPGDEILIHIFFLLL